MECTVTSDSDGEEVIAADRGVEQNQCAHDSDDLRAGSYRGRGGRSSSRDGGDWISGLGFIKVP